MKKFFINLFRHWYLRCVEIQFSSISSICSFISPICAGMTRKNHTFFSVTNVNYINIH
jgi:hypothetical protein